ncbi:MAG: xanthine dehydrogenase accessory protein XdhC [Betaproteobacteria bacterium]|nr:MAG: xanthine dehydrogenase accessory protein XdhC [Betaproteobacteria bacterium]
MSDWVEELRRLRSDGTPAVLVIVASIKGSAPREPGAKMIVTARDVYGTIGGGHLEHKAVAIARDQLAAGAAGGELRRFPLGASLGQCCGGLVNLLFEPVDGDAAWLDALATLRRRGQDAVVVTVANGGAKLGKLVVMRDEVTGSLGSALDARACELARALFADGAAPRLVAIAEGDLRRTLYLEPVCATEFTIVLFGAGHVGRAIVRTLADLPCRITWVDERADQFPRDVPGNVAVACTDIPEAEVDAAPAGAYFLVMTHSHALDETLTERILRRADYAYFGLIGSLTKRRSFERRIERRGLPAARFATMTCPIGVAGISNKEPAAIAIAVAAELLQTRERRGAAVPAQARRA